MNSRLGYKTYKLCVPILFFADNELLIGETIEEIEILFELLIQTTAECGLDINLNKCKCLIFTEKNIKIKQKLKKLK